MSIETKKAILSERNQVFEHDFKVQLIESCSIDTGIIRLNKEQQLEFIGVYEKNKEMVSFFIPSSGSGSRMFAFLYKWLENEVETEEIKSFFEKVESFPFFCELSSPKSSKRKLIEEIVAKFAHLPKGLIPFHSYDGKINTAFQEHVQQISQFLGQDTKIHFTIQKEFENEIRKNVGDVSNISFSYQNDETDAYCFDENQNVVKDGNNFIRRPAGHGALLENLNSMDADIVVLKNIDNVQRYSKSLPFKTVSQQLIGVLISFKKELKKLFNDFSTEGLRGLNNRFPFIHPSEIENVSKKDLALFANRPSRICGMVKNEGEPGGGPFWINGGEVLSNQIIEKAQINFENDEQREIVQKSSHFNPVFIVLSKSDVDSNTLDLMKYRDDTKFFVVEKNHKGKKIFYRELPGLWNGSMSNWNTIFVEIPLEVFTPVKSVLDLL